MENKLGNISNFAGAVLSLDQRKAPYFGVGMGPNKRPILWFTIKEWCQVVPEGITDADAKQIQRAIAEGILVNGRVYLPIAVKDEDVLNKYVDMTRQMVLDAKAKAPFISLLRYTKEGNWTAKEILVACLTEEQRLRRRANWMTFLNECIKFYSGPDILVEDYSWYSPEMKETPVVKLEEAPVAPKPLFPPTPVSVAPAPAPKGKGKAAKSELTEAQKEALLKQALGEAI